MQQQWIEKCNWNEMNVFIRVQVYYRNYTETAQKHSNWENKYELSPLGTQLQATTVGFILFDMTFPISNLNWNNWMHICYIKMKWGMHIISS